MKLRAIIIDDELDGIKSLRLLLEKYFPEINIIAETSVTVDGLRFIDNYQPDVVFLDINMPGMTGIELAKNVTYKEFKLIYTTAHEEYALEALKLGTTDYLLKPIDIDDLKEAIAKVKERMKDPVNFVIHEQIAQLIAESNKKHRILISDKETTEYCAPEDIIRLEARSNYTWVVFHKKKNMLVSKTLKDFEKQLNYINTPFMRVHQSHIVNINYCLRYKKEDGGLVEMSDEFSVPISASRKGDFLAGINFV